MGFFRFRRTIKVAPGVRLNVGKTGISTTVGVDGAKVTTGKRGTTTTVGVPGSGLSYSERSEPQPAQARGALARVIKWVLLAFLGACLLMAVAVAIQIATR